MCLPSYFNLIIAGIRLFLFFFMSFKNCSDTFTAKLTSRKLVELIVFSTWDNISGAVNKLEDSPWIIADPLKGKEEIFPWWDGWMKGFGHGALEDVDDKVGGGVHRQDDTVGIRVRGMVAAHTQYTD